MPATMGEPTPCVHEYGTAGFSKLSALPVIPRLAAQPTSENDTQSSDTMALPLRVATMAPSRGSASTAPSNCLADSLHRRGALLHEVVFRFAQVYSALTADG